MRLKDCVEKYNVKKSTLYDRIGGKKFRSVEVKKPGPQCALGAKTEQRVVDWIIYSARIGNGKSRDQVIEKIHQLAIALNEDLPFKTGLPSNTWYYRFLDRHPEISLRSPIILSADRAAVQEVAVRDWFSKLRQYLVEEASEDILEDPKRIFNMDETGFPFQPKLKKVLGATEDTHIYGRGAVTKENITVVVCFSPAGDYVTPYIVYPSKRGEFQAVPLQAFPEAKMGYSQKGWMTAELFVDWVCYI